MSRFKSLGRAIAPVLRPFRRRVAVASALPAYLTPVGRFLEELEARRFCDTPISPGLSYAYFASPTLLFGTPASFGQISSEDLDAPPPFSVNPVTGAQTAFEVAYSGTLTIAPDQAGTYYFQLPAAEGAILTIDGQSIIFAPSVVGDANLDGMVDITDLNTILSHYGDTGKTWTGGDFNGDGSVDITDLDDVLSNYGDTATPVIINNDGSDNPFDLPLGINLAAGNHNIQLDYFQYNDGSSGQTPEALLQWMTSATGTYSGMSSLTLSPYETPVITPVSSVAGVVGTALGNQTIATFSASAPGTSPTDYSATVAWSDSTNETATVVADGNGFAVQSNRTLPQTAGPLTGRLTVMHNASGFSSSAAISITVKPAAPTNLQAMHNPATGAVTISWTPAAGSTQTLIERSDDSGNSWTPVATVPVNSSGSTSTCTTTDNISGESSALYRATSEVGSSADGTGDDLKQSGTTSSPVETSDMTQLAAPSSLVAYSNAPQTINLAWLNNASDQTGVTISESTDGINFNAIATIATTNTYPLTNLQAGQHYYFEVAAVDNGAASSESNIADCTAQAPALTVNTSGIAVQVGMPFTGLIGHINDNDSQDTISDFTVTVNWGDGTTNNDAFLVAAQGGGFDVIGTHTYSEPPASGITITLTRLSDQMAVSSSGSGSGSGSNVEVTDDSLSGSLASINPVEGVLWQGVVATFTDSDPLATAAEFGVTNISWDGDGTDGISPQISGGDGHFTVTAQVLYHTNEPVPFSITISGGHISSGSITLGEMLHITPSIIDFIPDTLQGVEGWVYSGSKITSYTNSDPEAADPTSVKILWIGETMESVDGSVAGADNGLPGWHTITSPPTPQLAWPVAMGIVTLVDGISINVDVVVITVLPAPVSKSGPTSPIIGSPTGQASSGYSMNRGSLLSFITVPWARTSDLTATIHWGDGSTSDGDIEEETSTPGVFSVSGSHTYNKRYGGLADPDTNTPIWVGITDHGEMVGALQTDSDAYDDYTPEEELSEIQFAPSVDGNAPTIQVQQPECWYSDGGNSTSGGGNGGGGGGGGGGGSSGPGQPNPPPGDPGPPGSNDNQGLSGSGVNLQAVAYVPVGPNATIATFSLSSDDSDDDSGDDESFSAQASYYPLSGSGYGGTLPVQIAGDADYGYTVTVDSDTALDNPGYYSVTTAVEGDEGDSANFTSNLIVDYPWLQVAGVSTLNETAGASFTTTIGTLLTPDTNASDFNVSVNWGDGTTSSNAQLQYAGNTSVGGNSVALYDIVGTHTYGHGQNSPYSVAITVTENADSNVTSMAATLISVPPLTPPPATTLNPTDQVSLTGSHERVNFDGDPLPDISPTGQGESDSTPDTSAIDMYTLTPTITTTDVSVPMPSGDLSLDFRRTLGLGSTVTNDDGTATSSQWAAESILGPGWNTNIASRVVITQSSSDAEPKATVVDDVGDEISYESNGTSFVADVDSNLSNDALKNTLVQDGSDLTYTEEYGTKLQFEPAGASQVLTEGSTSTTSTYYRLASITDPNGNVLDFDYSGSPDPTLVSRIYDPSVTAGTNTPARQLTFSYTQDVNGDYRLATVTDPLGRVYQYSYYTSGVQAGCLSTVTEPAVANPSNPSQMVSPSTQYAYIVKNIPLQVISENGDAQPAPTQNITWYLPQTIADAEATGLTDPNHTTQFTYNWLYQPSGIELEKDSVTGNEEGVGIEQLEPVIASVTTADGTARFDELSRNFMSATTVVYDTRAVAGRPDGATTTYKFGSDTAAEIVPADNSLGYGIIIDQIQRTTTTSSSDAPNQVTGSVLEKFSDDFNGNLVSVTDMSGNTTQYIYGSDQNQLLSKPSEQIVDHGTGHLNLTTYYSYDGPWNKLSSETDPDGVETTYGFDTNGNRTSVTTAAGTPVEATTDYTYDSTGFMTSMTDPDGHETEYVPDSVYHNLQETIVDPGTGNLNLTTHRVSDVLDRTDETIDPNGNVNTYTYDNLNREISETLAAVAIAGYNPLSGQSPTLSTGTVTNLYDLNSNLISQTDADGHVTTYTYDDFGRRTSMRVRMSSPTIDSASDLVTTYAYDPAGLLESETDPDGNTTQYQHDALGRLIEVIAPTVSESGPMGSYGGQSITSYEYGANSGSGAFDNAFNPTQVTDPDGNVTDTVYDAAYRATSVTKVSRSYGGSNEDTDMTYDADGRPVEVTVQDQNAQGTEEDRNSYTFYDQQGRPTVSVVDMAGSGLSIAPGTFVDDPTSFSAPSGDLVTRTGYDSAGEKIFSIDPLGNETQMAYDHAGRLVEMTLPAVNLNGTSVQPTTSLTYDADGNVIQSVDANGDITQTQYDARNQPIKVTRTGSASGSATAVTYSGYDQDGNTIFTIDADGNRTDYTYDLDSRVMEAQAPLVADGANGDVAARPTTLKQYDADGNVIREVDPRGIVTTTSYDQMGRPWLVTVNANAAAGSADQSITETQYDADGNATEILKLIGNNGATAQTTDMTYDAFGQVLQEQKLNLFGDSIDNSITYTYDEAGNVLSATDARGNTTSYAYDLDNRKTQMIQPPAQVGQSPEITSYSYDLNSNLIGTTDPRGFMTSYVYDALSRKTQMVQPSPDGTQAALTTSYGYDLDGNLTSTTDPRGFTTTYVYDALGRKTQMDQPSPDGVHTPITHYAYDADGNLLSTTDPMGSVTSYRYDALGRTIRTIAPSPDGVHAGPETTNAYDLDGNLVSTTDPRGSTTSYVYDGLNRKVRQTGASPNGQTPGPVTTYTYDPVGNLLSTTDPNGQTTSYVYDQLGNKIEMIQPPADSSQQPRITTYEYDDNNNLIRSTDPLGNVTTFAYDALNGKTQETDPDPDGSGPLPAPVTSWTYDADGNELSETDPDGNVTSFGYDRDNRQITATTSQGTQSTQYDADGNVTQSTDRDGKVTQYTYDALDRQTSEKWLSGGSVIYTLSNSYDLDGRLLVSEDANSYYQFTYNGLGQITSETGYGPDNSPEVILTLTYDLDGNRRTMAVSSNGNAQMTDSYTYDALDRLVNLSEGNVDGSTENVSFSYDADGNTTGISRSGNGNPVASSSDIYDAEDELTQLTQANSTGTLAAYSWGYDADGRTVSQSAPEGTVSYGYDNDGQLISSTSSDDSALAGSYSYDANGNRTSSSSASSYNTGADNELTNDGTYSWTYDNDGNPLVRTTLATGATLTYTWDNRNRLTDLTYYTAGGTETEHIHYVYDPFDRRIAEQIATSSRALSSGRYDSSIYYSYGADPSTDEMLLISDSNGNITDRLLNGPGQHQVMADETASGTTWLLADGQGTVRDVVSNSGAELDHLSYDAYGNVLSQSNSSYAPLFQYTGMQADSSGLLYDYHRYYDPQDGRFISQDPSGFAAGDADLYRYVGNGPANGVDPRGLDQWSDDAAFAATVLRLGNRAPAEYRNNPFYVPPDVNPYAVVQQYGACAICHGSANGDWINLASGLDNRPVPLGQMAALQVTAHGNEDLNAAAGMIDGAAAVTALVVASIACPPLGVVLAGVGIGVGISDATNRVQQDHEPMEQALFGAATDVTGLNGLYAGPTGNDLATGNDLGLSDFQRGFGFGAGIVGAPAAAAAGFGAGSSYFGGGVPDFNDTVGGGVGPYGVSPPVGADGNVAFGTSGSPYYPSGESSPLLDQIRASGGVLPIGSPDVPFQDLALASRASGNEIGLYQDTDTGQHYLMEGYPTKLDIPAGSNLLLHVQPGDGMMSVIPSVDDRIGLTQLGQESSLIINSEGTLQLQFGQTNSLDGPIQPIGTSINDLAPRDTSEGDFPPAPSETLPENPLPPDSLDNSVEQGEG